MEVVIRALSAVTPGSAEENICGALDMRQGQPQARQINALLPELSLQFLNFRLLNCS